MGRNVGCGVPEGSVLGPLLFILYTADLRSIIAAFGLAPHSYADDSQIYSSCLPGDVEALRERFIECLVAVSKWAEENRLALNVGKTEFMWVSTPRRRMLVSRKPFAMGDVTIVPSECVRLLGVLFDGTLSFEPYVNDVIRRCHFQLKRIRSVRRYLPVSGVVHLVRALVLTRVDYCNSVLLGLPVSKLERLQSVLNLSARIVFGCRWCEHVTPLLRDRLHWLRVPERIVFKRCWLTYRALHDPCCPEYLASLVKRPQGNDRRSSLRSSRGVKLHVPPPSKTAKFGERSFTRGNPILWNSLPDETTTADTPEHFIKRLKTHLFRLGYS